jgi:hypothetical protein
VFTSLRFCFVLRDVSFPFLLLCVGVRAATTSAKIPKEGDNFETQFTIPLTAINGNIIRGRRLRGLAADLVVAADPQSAELKQLLREGELPVRTTEIVFAKDNFAEGVAHPCGSHKCLFPIKESSTASLLPLPLASSSSATNEQSIGLLVAGYNPAVSHSTQQAWEFASNITSPSGRDRYDMDHVYLSDPQVIHVDNIAQDAEGKDELSMGAWLDQQNTFNIAQKPGESAQNYRKPTFEKQDSFVIQEVIIVDTGGTYPTNTTPLGGGDDNRKGEDQEQYQHQDVAALFFGYGKHKRQQGWERVEQDFIIPLLARLYPQERQLMYDKLVQQATKLQLLIRDSPAYFMTFKSCCVPMVVWLTWIWTVASRQL